MMLRQVEVMDLVAEVILEGEDARARVHRQPEREAALAVGAERMHAHFHHALPDRPVVAVTRQVPDGVEHQLSNATSIG